MESQVLKSSLEKVRVASICSPVRTLGFGRRVGVWLQGCLQRCSGCISPEYQNLNGGFIYSKQEFARTLGFTIRTQNISGITFTGGEPLLQNNVLREVSIELKQEFPELDILVFTGYRFNRKLELVEGKSFLASKSSIDWIDTLVDGEFKEELSGNHLLKGSSNQKISFLSPLGKKRFKMDLQEKKNKKRLDLFFDSGQYFLAGIPGKNMMNRFYENLHRSGITLQTK